MFPASCAAVCAEGATSEKREAAFVSIVRALRRRTHTPPATGTRPLIRGQPGRSISETKAAGPLVASRERGLPARSGRARSNPGANAARCRMPEPELAGAPPTPAATLGAGGTRRFGNFLGGAITRATRAVRFVRRRETAELVLDSPPTAVWRNVEPSGASSAPALMAGASGAKVIAVRSSVASPQFAPSWRQRENRERNAPALVQASCSSCA